MCRSTSPEAVIPPRSPSTRTRSSSTTAEMRWQGIGFAAARSRRDGESASGRTAGRYRAPGGVYLGAWVRPEVTHSVFHSPLRSRRSSPASPPSMPDWRLARHRPHLPDLEEPGTNPAGRASRGGRVDPDDRPACGDTDANIIVGSDDALITAEAQELAALKAPVFLRWYYEPNFPSSKKRYWAAVDRRAMSPPSVHP